MPKAATVQLLTTTPHRQVSEYKTANDSDVSFALSPERNQSSVSWFPSSPLDTLLYFPPNPVSFLHVTVVFASKMLSSFQSTLDFSGTAEVGISSTAPCFFLNSREKPSKERLQRRALGKSDRNLKAFYCEYKVAFVTTGSQGSDNF